MVLENHRLLLDFWQLEAVHQVKLLKKSVSRMVYKEKSKSVGHTPSRPSTETVHSKRKFKCFNILNNVDDLGKISSLLGEVLKRLERTEAKLESVEHKLESFLLSSSSCSEKKREVPQIVKVRLMLPSFLNQARAGRRPARAWFLEITLVRTSVCVFVYVCVCVCPPPRL